MPIFRFSPLLGAALLLVTIVHASDVVIDARGPAAPAPSALPVAIGARSPDGHVLGANTQLLTMDGQPWYPVLGEFHYSRCPAEEWERELLKMKAGGITVVSTYVFWNHHEETAGHFDWSGQRDLRRFIELCGRHGLLVWLRVGPWAHGEARNGGFPDWLVQSGIPLRQNDPKYLEYVNRFFGEIARQVSGQFWSEGGPIVGVQIENEYHPPLHGLEHMLTLRGLALEHGMKPAYFSATGWDNAVVPRDGFLPVFGGYTEQFWSGLLTRLPPNQNFFFTNIRAEDNVMGDLSPKNAAYNTQYDDRPYLTAELGAGMSIAYHRRPIMHADDSTAAAVVKLGSGVNALGFYMYHGGTNPDGATPLQETQHTWNGYNDMEAKSYDFQAPLGEFGQVNDTYRALRTVTTFLNHFGTKLAPMAPIFPTTVPANRDDIHTPRVAARTLGDQAFVFINNYERNYPLGAKNDFRVTLRLPHGDLTIPRTPTTLPDGAYPIWPVNLDLGGGTLRYATAQLLTEIATPHTYVFFAWPGLDPEFAFDLPSGTALEAPHARVTRTGDVTFVDHVTPGTGVAIRLNGPTPLQIVVLSRDQALHLADGAIGGHEHLVLSSGDVAFDDPRIDVSTRQDGPLTVGVFPAVRQVGAPFRATAADGIFQTFAYDVPPAPKENVSVDRVKSAAPAQPVKLSAPPRAVAEEPAEADFDRASQWTVHVDPSLRGSSDRWLLQVRYTGDVARVFVGGKLFDDNFYKGTPWELGLWRVSPAELQSGLTLKILPLRKDAPIFLESGAWPDFQGKSEALAIANLTLIREAHVTAEVKP